MSSDWLFIPNNVPSLKNSKEIVRFGKHPNMKTALVPSKTHKKYAKATALHWKTGASQFHKLIEGVHKPLYVMLYFVRDTRRKWDFGNATATVEDLMVEYGWIPDDNADEFIPFYAGHRVDKEKPGVYISIIRRDTPYLERIFKIQDEAIQNTKDRNDYEK